MHRFVPMIALIALWAAPFGCSDDSQTPVDAALSDGPAPFDLAPTDQATDGPSHDVGPLDGLGPDLQPRDGAESDGPSTDTMNSHDGPTPDPGPVQCRNDGECAAGQTCTRSAPGGICFGCGTCLDPIDFECRAGGCVRYCSGDNQCNAGMRCSDTGYCVIRDCSASEPCPAPYVCGDSGRCARPACGVGTGCPAPLICEASICVEP